MKNYVLLLRDDSTDLYYKEIDKAQGLYVWGPAEQATQFKDPRDIVGLELKRWDNERWITVHEKAEKGSLTQVFPNFFMSYIRGHKPEDQHLVLYWDACQVEGLPNTSVQGYMSSEDKHAWCHHPDGHLLYDRELTEEEIAAAWKLNADMLLRWNVLGYQKSISENEWSARREKRALRTGTIGHVGSVIVGGRRHSGMSALASLAALSAAVLTDVQREMMSKTWGAPLERSLAELEGRHIVTQQEKRRDQIKRNQEKVAERAIVKLSKHQPGSELRNWNDAIEAKKKAKKERRGV